jgi:hypothetical protein
MGWGHKNAHKILVGKSLQSGYFEYQQGDITDRIVRQMDGENWGCVEKALGHVQGRG